MSFFKLNIKILKVSGLWLDPTSKYSHFYLIYNTLCVLYAIILFTLAELMSLKQSSANIFDLVKNLNMSLSFLLTFFKVLVWFRNRKRILGIMELLQDSLEKFKHGLEIVPRDEKLSRQLSMTFFILACTVPTSACLLSLWTVKDLESGPFKLPYYSYVPFDYQRSKFFYCLAIFYQCLALLICGMMTVGFDMLFFSLTNFVSTHLFLLQEAFKNIKFRNSSSNSMKNELKIYIKHLQVILKICDKLEEIFSFLILLQMLISLIVFCTCLYIISMLPLNGSVFGNEIAYMLAIENQLAVYCFAGNKLTSRAERIPFALYSSDWYQTGTGFRRNLLFVMMRMNKSIHLTAGKFTPLTLATFVTICRGSYSLLAVLKKSNAVDINLQ